MTRYKTVEASNFSPNFLENNRLVEPKSYNAVLSQIETAFARSGSYIFSETSEIFLVLSWLYSILVIVEFILLFVILGSSCGNLASSLTLASLASSISALALRHRNQHCYLAFIRLIKVSLNI